MVEQIKNRKRKKEKMQMRERHGDKTSHKQRERFNRIEKINRERGGTSSTKRDRNRVRERIQREQRERQE